MWPSKRKPAGNSAPVYLNVYDLTPINGYAYWVGLGIYHSGVQGKAARFWPGGRGRKFVFFSFFSGRRVDGLKHCFAVHDVEYAYGAHEQATTGIFEGEPRQCPGFRFRKSILIGRTELGAKEVRSLMEKLAEDYTGNAYHLISKNCNHFCNDACLRLTGKPIPRWVNRLATLGRLPSTPFLTFSAGFGWLSGDESLDLCRRGAVQVRAAGGGECGGSEAGGGGGCSGDGGGGGGREEEAAESFQPLHIGFRVAARRCPAETVVFSDGPVVPSRRCRPHSLSTSLISYNKERNRQYQSRFFAISCVFRARNKAFQEFNT